MRGNRGTLLGLVLLVALVQHRRARAAICMGNTSGDEADSCVEDGICDPATTPKTVPPRLRSGICPLRAAMTQAHASLSSHCALPLRSLRHQRWHRVVHSKRWNELLYRRA